MAIAKKAPLGMNPAKLKEYRIRRAADAERNARDNYTAMIIGLQKSAEDYRFSLKQQDSGNPYPWVVDCNIQQYGIFWACPMYILKSHEESIDSHLQSTEVKSIFQKFESYLKGIYAFFSGRYA